MSEQERDALAAVVALEMMRRPYDLMDMLSSVYLERVDMELRADIVDRAGEIIQQAVDVVVGEHFTEDLPLDADLG